MFRGQSLTFEYSLSILYIRSLRWFCIYILCTELSLISKQQLLRLHYLVVLELFFPSGYLE